MVRSSLMISFGILFAWGLWPPENPWLMAIGLGGFIGACFIPKDF